MTAYRMANCWDRVGYYHLNARKHNQVSPLMRYDYSTILYILGNRIVCPDQLLNEMLARTFELIEQGKPIHTVSRKTVMDCASRWRGLAAMKQEQALYAAHPAFPEDIEPIRLASRNVKADMAALEGGTLPDATRPATDHHGNPVPAELAEIFQTREHFARLRDELRETARQLHALMHTPAGKHINRQCTQRLLGIAEDINISCPVLVEGNDWICTKTLVRRNYRRDRKRARKPTTTSENPSELPEG